MTLDTYAYCLDELAIPWGCTLAEAAAQLPGQLSEPPGPHESPTLRGACRAVLGLPTTAYALRAPGLHKPVLHASYRLAAPPPRPGEPVPTEPFGWLAPLLRQLGPSDQDKSGTARDPGGDYWATWRRPTVSLTVAAYRLSRPEANGVPCGGELAVAWLDSAAAAWPFFAAAQAQTAALEAVVAQTTDLALFEAQVAQWTPDKRPVGWVPPAAPAAPEPWQLQQALYQDATVPTPATLRAQLSARQIALWRVPGRGDWAVSTQHYTVLLSQLTRPEVVLLTVRPARGGGDMFLYVGSLILCDTYQSPTLGQLAAAIAARAGIRVVQQETLDC